MIIHHPRHKVASEIGRIEELRVPWWPWPSAMVKGTELEILRLVTLKYHTNDKSLWFYTRLELSLIGQNWNNSQLSWRKSFLNCCFDLAKLQFERNFHFWGPRAAAMYRVWTGSHLVWYQLLYHINLLYQHRNIFRPQGLANQELHNTRRPSVCTSWLNALSRLINMTPKLSQRWSRLSCRHPEPFSLSFGVKPLCPRVTVWYESWVIETYCPHFNEF